QRSLGIRMVGYRLRKLDCAQRTAGGDIQSYSHRTLMQVGFAVRGAGSQTQHRHNRIAFEHNNPDIGHAFVGISLERIIKLDQIFNDHHIRFAAERIEPGQRITHVPADVFNGNFHARGFDEFVSAPPNNDQNALAARALCRLDGKAVEALEFFFDGGNFVLLTDYKKQRRRGHLKLFRKQLGFKLVIDQGKKMAGIITADKIAVTAVHSQNSHAPQAPRTDPFQKYTTPNPTTSKRLWCRESPAAFRCPNWKRSHSPAGELVKVSG